MLPQLVATLVQLALVNPQFFRQLLRADCLHSLYRSSFVFPTPTPIPLPLLHSLLRGEFPCCLILGGHSRAETLSGSLHSASVSRCAGFFGYGRDDSPYKIRNGTKLIVSSASKRR